MHVTNILECSNISLQAGVPGVTGQPAGGCISRSQAGAGRPGPGSVLALNVAHSSTQRISRYDFMSLSCHYVILKNLPYQEQYCRESDCDAEAFAENERFFF